MVERNNAVQKCLKLQGSLNNSIIIGKKALDIAQSVFPGDFVAADVLDNVDFLFFLFMIPQLYEGLQKMNDKTVLLLQ